MESAISDAVHLIDIQLEDHRAAHLNFDRNRLVDAGLQLRAHHRRYRISALAVAFDDLQRLIDPLLLNAQKERRVSALQKSAGRRQSSDAKIMLNQVIHQRMRIIILYDTDQKLHLFASHASVIACQTCSVTSSIDLR